MSGKRKNNQESKQVVQLDPIEVEALATFRAELKARNIIPGNDEQMVFVGCMRALIMAVTQRVQAEALNTMKVAYNFLGDMIILGGVNDLGLAMANSLRLRLETGEQDQLMNDHMERMLERQREAGLIEASQGQTLDEPEDDDGLATI